MPANAANPLELNFWLSGPRYDGRVAECERALSTIASQFQEKEGKFWNSALVITGFGRIGPHKCLIIANHKGKDTKEKVQCFFGPAHPEGYRKALRFMDL